MDVLGIAQVVCTVVGALVIYCALMAAVWALLVRLVRTRAAVRSRLAAAGAAALDVGGQSAQPDAADRRARSWDELPAWLSRDRPWAVAVVLLGAPAIRDRTATFVDFANRRINWIGLLTAAETWPADQRLMVMTAHELAFDTVSDVERALSEPVTLQDMVTLLDDEGVERITVAMDVRRGRVELGEALTRLAG